MRRQVCALGLSLLVSGAAGCHKKAELKEQPRSAVSDGAPSGTNGPAPAPVPVPAPAPSLAAMMADDPGRCVKQVIVGDEAIAFEFNRDYYWYLGNIGDMGSSGLRSQRPPYYALLPRHYTQLYLGSELSCGRNADQSIECWGFDSRGMLGRRGTEIKTPILLTGPSSRIQLFALRDREYCAFAGAKVVCPAPFNGGSGEVQNLGDVKQLGKGTDVDFSCASNEAQVWCWGSQWLPPHPSILPYSLRVAMPIAMPGGVRIRSLHVGTVHACVLGVDGAVYCFGRGDYGSWGNGKYGYCTGRQPVCKYAASANYVAALGKHVKELGVGAGFTCALKDDGTVWCWGSNGEHIVGNQEHIVTSDAGTKMAIEPLPLQRAELGTDNRSIKIAEDFACVEKNDGALWCWGNNHATELALVQSTFEPPHQIPLPAPRCAGAH